MKKHQRQFCQRKAEADSFEKEVCGLENTAEIIESEHSKNKRDLGINEILYINENAPFTQSAFFGENCACEIFWANNHALNLSLVNKTTRK